MTNLRIDFDEIEQQLDEITNAKDREVEANKRLVDHSGRIRLLKSNHFSLKQEIHDLRQKLELQSAESDENQNNVRRRFQDSLTELTSQVEALSKGKSR